jgi:hypothetical protein
MESEKAKGMLEEIRSGYLKEAGEERYWEIPAFIALSESIQAAQKAIDRIEIYRNARKEP